MLSEWILNTNIHSSWKVAAWMNESTCSCMVPLTSWTQAGSIRGWVCERRQSAALEDLESPSKQVEGRNSLQRATWSEQNSLFTINNRNNEFGDQSHWVSGILSAVLWKTITPLWLFASGGLTACVESMDFHNTDSTLQSGKSSPPLVQTNTLTEAKHGTNMVGNKYLSI